MTNKKFWLGMLAMILTFGVVLMASCNDDKDGNATIIVKNEGTQSITVKIPSQGYSYDLSVTDEGKDVSIENGGSKTYSVTWAKVNSNGTHQDISMYIDKEFKKIIVVDGDTTAVTKKDDGSISVQ